MEAFPDGSRSSDELIINPDSGKERWGSGLGTVRLLKRNLKMESVPVTSKKPGELTPREDQARPVTDQNDRNEPINPAKSEVPQTGIIELIHVGQNVFTNDDQPLGRITKKLPGHGERASYLAIRAAHFWGSHKLLPVELVNSVPPQGVRLSIDRRKFQELPDYQTDASIKNKLETALWNDRLLRIVDYPEIDIRVEDGIVTFSGHISGRGNEKRIESIAESIQGVLGVTNYLVKDDDLLLEVVKALIQIERVEGNHVFAKVENGVVGLSGKVVSVTDRNLAEQYTANVPSIRGVINLIKAPGIDPDPKEQLFLQPTIGEKIFFSDGLFGFVRQVIIDRNNRCVTGMIIQGRFPNTLVKSGFTTSEERRTSDRLAVIPVNVMRYLTSISGFLHISSSETSRYENFDPANFVAPASGWLPPSPYGNEDIMLSAAA